MIIKKSGGVVEIFNAKLITKVKAGYTIDSVIIKRGWDVVVIFNEGGIYINDYSIDSLTYKNIGGKLQLIISLR